MRKRWSSLLVLSLPYLIIAFLPIISVLGLGSVLLHNYQEQMLLDKQRNIEASFESYLKKINNIETLSYTITRNGDMQRYIFDSINRKEHTLLTCMELKNLLSGFMVNKDIAAIYFYDLRDERIISSTSVMTEAADYFRYAYQLTDYTPEESIARLNTSSWGIEYISCLDAIIDDTGRQVIEYRTALPMGMKGNVQGHLVFVLDVEELFGNFIDVLGEGSEFYVYDSKNKLIYGNGNQYEDLLKFEEGPDIKSVKYGDKNVFGMVCQSYNQKWKIKVFMSDFTGISERMFLYIWLMVIFPIVGSVVLCVYFTHKNHREIKNLLILLRGHGASADYEYDEESIGYRSIREYANKLVYENDKYKERIDHYEENRKCMILDKLIRNVYGSKEEAKEFLDTINSNVMVGKCVVLLIRYEGAYYRTHISENVTIKDFVKELVGKCVERKFDIFDISARETACVLSVDDTENVEVILRDIISKLNVEVGYYFDIEVQFSAGNVVESIYNIHNSYIQAKKVFDYNETSGNKLYLYSELTQLKDVYYYPREFDERIYNYVVVGKVEEAKETIQKILQENFAEDNNLLSARAIELVKGRLKNCLLSIAEKYEVFIENKITELEREQNIRNYFDMVEALIDIIAEEIICRKNHQQSKLISRIVNYVEESYGDNTLSLKKIATTFGFAEAYLSNLFKNTYGENLSVFIEKCRIEKACNLIKNTNMKIGDIAETVGYTSDVSFRRAFKKVTGISPGEYRER